MEYKKLLAEATKEVLGSKGFDTYVEEVMEHRTKNTPKEEPFELKEYYPEETDKDQWILEHKAEYEQMKGKASKTTAA